MLSLVPISNSDVVQMVLMLKTQLMMIVSSLVTKLNSDVVNMTMKLQNPKLMILVVNYIHKVVAQMDQYSQEPVYVQLMNSVVAQILKLQENQKMILVVPYLLGDVVQNQTLTKLELMKMMIVSSLVMKLNSDVVQIIKLIKNTLTTNVVKSLLKDVVLMVLHQKNKDVDVKILNLVVAKTEKHQKDLLMTNVVL